MTANNPTPTQQETLDERADRLLQRLIETPAGERIRMKCGAADLRSVITDLLDTRTAIAGPRVDRALYSELIHIAAELARGTDFLSTCAEDMNPRLKRADILKTAERQDLQLKDWANRVRQVADKLSAAATSSSTPASPLSLLLATAGIKCIHDVPEGLTCAICGPVRSSTGAAVTGPRGDAATTARNRDVAQRVVMSTESVLGERFDIATRHELADRITAALDAATSSPAPTDPTLSSLLAEFADTAIKCHIGFKHDGPWQECKWIECEDRRKMIESFAPPADPATVSDCDPDFSTMQ